MRDQNNASSCWVIQIQQQDFPPGNSLLSAKTWRLKRLKTNELFTSMCLLTVSFPWTEKVCLFFLCSFLLFWGKERKTSEQKNTASLLCVTKGTATWWLQHSEPCVCSAIWHDHLVSLLPDHRCGGYNKASLSAGDSYVERCKQRAKCAVLWTFACAWTHVGAGNSAKNINLFSFNTSTKVHIGDTAKFSNLMIALIIALDKCIKMQHTTL